MPIGDRFLLLIKCLLVGLLLAALSPLPFSAPARFALQQADRARLRGDLSQAVDRLRFAVEREPWRVYLWEEIGRLELERGAPQQAVASFQTAVSAGALSVDTYLLLGDAYAGLEQPAAAQAAWQAVLQAPAPQELRGQAYERLVNFQRQQENYSGAVQVLRGWQVEEPASARVAYQLGLILSVTEPDSAFAHLLEAARFDATYTGPVQALRRGLNLATGSDDAAYRALVIGRSLRSIQQWDLAAASYRRSLDANPQYAEAWAFLSEAQYYLGQDGTTEIQQALALNPNSVLVRALAAIYYRRQGEPAQALEYLNAIAIQEPEEPIWQVEIGSTLAQAGDLPAALQAYQKAVDMAPQNAVYWQHLARFSIEYNYDLPAIGIPAARLAVILAPDNPASLDVMGLALFTRGDWASAERFLQQALDSDTTYAPAHLHLAMLYIQREQYDRARPFLNRAASLDGENLVGQLARRLLRQYYGEG